MLQRNHLNDLPWESAVTELPNIEHEGSCEGIIVVENPQKNRPMISLCEPQSFATRVHWLPSEPTMLYESTDIFGPKEASVVVIMRDIEKMLVESKIPFFHPNDIVIIGKYDEDSFIRIEADISDLNITLTVKCTGQIESINSFLFGSIHEIMSI